MDKLFKNITIINGCWLWNAAKRNGYGLIAKDGKMLSAHRYSYELIKGPVPIGKVLDHLCRQPSCVNPQHLEAVTQKVNIERGLTGEHQRVKEYCPSGHSYSGSNLYTKPNGARICRECNRVSQQRHRDKLIGARI